jgi:hypothetical protein
MEANLKEKNKIGKLSDLKEGYFIKWEEKHPYKREYFFQYGQVKEIHDNYVRLLRFSDCELAYIYNYENISIITKDDITPEFKKMIDILLLNIKSAEIKILQINNSINDAKKNISTIESYLIL